MRSEAEILTVRRRAITTQQETLLELDEAIVRVNNSLIAHLTARLTAEQAIEKALNWVLS